MTAKSVLLRHQGLRARARDPTSPPLATSLLVLLKLVHQRSTLRDFIWKTSFISCKRTDRYASVVVPKLLSDRNIRNLMSTRYWEYH